jgi:hypothetical protein
MQNSSEPGGIILEGEQGVSPHNKALYDAGKKMLVDSLDVGRDFCKFMTTTSLGAIPTYIALLKLVLPKDYSLQQSSELLLLAPAFAFLLSSVLFVIGLYPGKGSVCLDYPSEIEQARNRLIARRRMLSVSGFSAFALAVAYASLLLVSQLVA